MTDRSRRVLGRFSAYEADAGRTQSEAVVDSVPIQNPATDEKRCPLIALRKGL